MPTWLSASILYDYASLRTILLLDFSFHRLEAFFRVVLSLIVNFSFTFLPQKLFYIIICYLKTQFLLSLYNELYFRS